MSLPPLNALRAFEAVARLGSFQAAGDALFVTPSAISHQIRNLESWLGGPVLRRDGNKAHLLDHGAELAQSLGLSLRQIEAACRKARSGGDAGPLVIAAIPSVAMCWLIPRLAQFQAAHPDVETRIIYAMHGRDIDFGSTHLAFVFAPQPPDIPGVTAQFFLDGTSLPVASPALASRLTRAADITRLGLLHDGDTRGWADYLQLGPAQAAQLGGPRFEDFNLLRAAALSGQGVALCPRAMVQPDLDAGRLCLLSERESRKAGDYYLLMTEAAGKRGAVFGNWAMAARSPDATCPAPNAPDMQPE